MFTRNCPDCNKEINYKLKSQLNEAIKKNRKCRKCGCGWSRGKTKETCESLRILGDKISTSLKGRVPWNKGLTRDDNDILAKMGDNHRGFKHSEETKKLIGEYSKEFWKNDDYRVDVINKVTIKKRELADEWVSTMEERGYFTPNSEKEGFNKYKSEVWHYTRKNDLTLLENHDKRGRMDVTDDAHHLDHKYSIAKGFINKVSPKIIGSIYNLEFIPWKENQIKKTNCSISLEELKGLYNESKDKI